MHGGSMWCMQKFVEKYLDEKNVLDIIDIGSADINGSYKSIFTKENWTYTGMDIEPYKNVDIVGWENIFKKYDVLISGQTLEHVNRPWDWVKNLKQYIKDNGLLCLIAPCVCFEHKCPLDTYRYFPDGMRDLLNYAEIEILEIDRFDINTVGIGRISNG